MALLFLYSVIFFVSLKKRRDERMSIYILEGQEKEIDTEKIAALTNRWLSETSAEYKEKFTDCVRSLIADLELDKPFYDCNGEEVCIEQYYFLACLIYVWNNGYKEILLCDNDLKIFDCLNNVTKEIYDEFVERTSDEYEDVDAEYFHKWSNEENLDGTVEI